MRKTKAKMALFNRPDKSSFMNYGFKVVEF